MEWNQYQIRRTLQTLEWLRNEGKHNKRLQVSVVTLLKIQIHEISISYLNQCYHFRCRTKEAMAIYHILDEFIVQAGYESDEAPMVIVRDYVKYCKFDPSVWSNSITNS